jgi:glycosyltransferase involved in cell wall biosynthesis
MPESILLVSHCFPPHIGGIENVVREQARHLALLGHDVTVLTTALGESAGARRQPDGYTVARVTAWNGVEQKTKVPFPVVTPWSLPTFLRLVRAADVVHVHDLLYMTSWLAALFSLVLRKPLVLTQHVQMIYHPSALVTAVQKLVYMTAGRGIVQVARRILYLNSTVFNFLVCLGAGHEKLSFVPNGVDTDAFYPVDADRKQRLREELGLPANDVLALFVGRFVPKKGYEIVLDSTRRRYRLVLVGDVPSAADRHRTGSIFLGPLTSRKLADVYRACDIFVLPSTSEGFPLSVQEAMASGLAVVISDDPGYDIYELDRERVKLVRRDVESVSAALEHIAADAEIRGRMARYSYELSTSRFSWMTHARALDNVYRDVLSVPAGG